MRTILSLLALLLACGCTTIPSYDGGPKRGEPHVVVSTCERLSVWKVDDHETRSRTGDLWIAPGSHTLKVRVEYTVDYEGEGNFEWHDFHLEAEEGRRYQLLFKAEGLTEDGEERRLDMPPYTIVAEEVRGGERRRGS